mmetsp:Transcript_31855/g.63113  ORF Transcript_31855/g.63113 Transcript_31855/m.63113 type:complete len:293 (-) Transcript_31855:148-1026(-)
MSRNHRRPLPKHNILNFVPTYPGNEADDVELIECFGDEQNRISVRMHRKQKIHEGDRSHRHLVELDAAKFNYAGYDADEEKFTNIHCENDRDCDEVLEKMYFSLLQKQTISKKMEDKFNYPVSYPGWEADAEDYLRYQESNTHIAARLSERIERKQQLFMGDRSHPAIEELDRLKCDYPGFPFDRKNYEALHCENTTFSEAALEKAYRQMTRREMLFSGNRHHELLVEMDEKEFTYPFFRRDVEELERLFGDVSPRTNAKMDTMVRKQWWWQSSKVTLTCGVLVLIVMAWNF